MIGSLRLGRNLAFIAMLKRAQVPSPVGALENHSMSPLITSSGEDCSHTADVFHRRKVSVTETYY